MTWHQNPECDSAITRLLDVFCQWERSTGQESLIVIIPVEGEEEVIFAESGKSMSDTSPETVMFRVRQALAAHENPTVHHFIECDEEGRVDNVSSPAGKGEVKAGKSTAVADQSITFDELRYQFKQTVLEFKKRIKTSKGVVNEIDIFVAAVDLVIESFKAVEQAKVDAEEAAEEKARQKMQEVADLVETWILSFPDIRLRGILQRFIELIKGGETNPDWIKFQLTL